MTYRPMSLAEKSKLKGQLARQGIHYTDSQLESLWQKKMSERSVAPTSPIRDEITERQTRAGDPIDEMFPQDTPQMPGSWGDSVLDFVGGSLWGALDTATIGLAGAAWKYADEDMYQDYMEDWQSSKLGRAGQTLGSLAGFMVPMTGVARAASLGVRGIRGAVQAGKMKAGMKIVNPTTRTMQRQAAEHILKASEKAAIGTKSKALTRSEAFDVARASTEDFVGFAQKGVLKKVFSRGPAYQMEHSLEFVNQARQGMAASLPNVLAKNLSKSGVSNLSKDSIIKLSDEIIETVGKRPFNQIESLFHSRYQGKLAQSVSNIAGSMAQEAVTFGLTGTAMDYVQWKAGNFDLGDMTMTERAIHHTMMGGVFGGVKFVPGGSKEGFFRKVGTFAGNSTRSINRAVKKMDTDEVKMFAQATMKNDAGAIFKVNGSRVTLDNLKKNRGLTTPDEIKGLKKAIINHNVNNLSDFRKGFTPEVLRDLVGSMPRMTIGALSFNYEALDSGAFDLLSPEEAAFHMGIGAIMTKHHRPLYRTGEAKMGFHPSERPHYYNSDLAKIKHSLDMQKIDTSHIGEIAKQFDGNLYTDYVNKQPQADVESIITALKENDVIYDASGGRVTPNPNQSTSLSNKDLFSLISPIGDVMKSRHLEFNPNMSKEGQSKALNTIMSLKSEALSTADNPLFLNSRRNIIKSMITSTSKHWTDMKVSLFDNFRQQMGVLMNDANYVNNNGRMKDYNFDSIDLTNPEHKQIIRKMDDIKQRFLDMDIIKIEDFTIGKGKGIEVKNREGMIDEIGRLQERFEQDWGKEFFGESLDMPVDMAGDGVLWQQFKQVDYLQNVTRLNDIIMGRAVQDVKPADITQIKSLVSEILSHKDNKLTEYVVDNPNKIKFNVDDWTGDAEEFLALQSFAKDLWQINVANGRLPQDSREVNVDINRVKLLHDNLVKQGLPDNILHRLDSRLQTWVDKAIQYGVDNATRGLDMSPHTAKAVKGLMMNGLIHQAEGNDNQGIRLMATSKLTEGQIKRIKQNATKEEIAEYIESYDRVMKLVNKDQNIIGLRDNMETGDISESQLSSILTAERILNLEKINKDYDLIADKFKDRVIKLDDDYQVLETSRDQAAEANLNKDAEDIQAIMEGNRKQKQELTNLITSFNRGMTGAGDLARASAHLDLTAKMIKSKGDGKGKDIFTLLDDFIDAPEDQWESISDQIRELQVEIANRISERADITTLWGERVQEEVRRLKHDDVEGHMPLDEVRVTPDKFFEEHNIRLDDVINTGDAKNLTFDSASEVLKKLYDESVYTKDGSVNKFTDRMFELAGRNRGNASDKLRSEVMHLSGLFERRFQVKKLGVDTTAGSGFFERSEISKGYLTDLYTEIFYDSGVEMTLLSPDYLHKNTLRSTATNDQGLSEISKVLAGSDFIAALSEGSISNMKYLKEGQNYHLSGDNMYDNIDMNHQVIKGRHYVVGVDENINIVLNQSQFDPLARSFVRWYNKIKDTDYVKKSKSKHEGAKELFNVLEAYFEKLERSETTRTEVDSGGREVTRKVYDFNKFMESRDNISGDQYMEDAMFTMFNVQYGEKADADWLGDAYLDAGTARKSYKYKRLAQNQGYTRNSREKRDILASIYGSSKNKYHRELIDGYDKKEDTNVLIIDDSVVSETGADVNGLLTDARSVVEANLELQKENGLIGKEEYEYMKKEIRDSNAVNAEQVNAMTAVRREYLDYILLMDGKSDMIGESSGQKPVGLTSFTDDAGRKHVFYNKTHYFYDSRLDNFFDNNKDIDQVAFKSGAKKAKVINPKNLKNEFEALAPPKIGDFDSLESWINTLSVKKEDVHVFNARFDEMLSGSIYGKAHDAKIMKQFDNWTSSEVAHDIYEWSRADVIDQFAEIEIELYNPEDTHRASAEAKSFIRGEGNTDGTLSTDAPNASVASIWLEADGVAFSEISKNLYDALIKRRHIDNAGVFDGYTDAGGVPVLRGNLSHDLNIPVYADVDGQRTQIKLGEANISESYLNRKIHFRADFGAMPGSKPGKIQRPKYKSKGTATVAFAHKNRDIVVDLKTLDILDTTNKDAKLSDAEFKDIKKQVNKIRGELKKKDGIVTWKDLHVRLQSDDYQGAQLAIMSMPAPRTGPHDAMVVKVKNMIDKKDGGIMELNSWDVTMRGQRDYDTDKLPFYMDTPWSAIKESYRKNGDIAESLPTDPANKFTGEVDMFNNQSFKNYNHNIQKYSRLRGPIVKMQRKLTYASRIFKDMDGLDLGDGTKITFTGDPRKAMQRLVNDSQNVLDIYNGLDTMLENVFQWEDRTLFTNSSKKDKRVDVEADNPFFRIEFENSETKGQVDGKTQQLIVKKILNDFGRLLSLEGDVYESGEARPAKYTDMATQYRDFIREYRGDRINWNFYNYLKKNGLESEADRIFFNNDAKLKDKKMINDLFGKLSGVVNDHPTPFLKSLKGIADRDHMRVRETYNPKGQSFNQQIDKLLGASRQEALEIFTYTGDLDNSYFDRKSNLINEMWKGFKAERSHEEMMTQVNYIEGNIRRLENLLISETKKNNKDQTYIDLQEENILIQRQALAAMLDKMSLDPTLLGQKLRSYSSKKGANNKVSNAYKDIVIRNGKTGEQISRVLAGKEWELKPGQVAVDNPVVVKAVVEHELIDGVAMARSALGYFSHVRDADMQEFSQVVKDTRRAIKESVKETMETKGVRDWSIHQSSAQNAIDHGLGRIIKLAHRNADDTAIPQPKQYSDFLGKMPTGRESYGVDFLMALLVPDTRSNPNEHFFSPKTGGFLPAVNAPKKSVINAVFGAMDKYGIHGNHKEFVQKFARTHRGFYDTIVSGRGWGEGLNRLATTSFEGALLKSTIDNVAHNPFMPRSEFSSVVEYFNNTPIMESQYSEMFRQILQEGALVDPATAFRIKRQIIEDPSMGIDAYNQIFKMSTGEILFDGLSSKQYALHKGEGQLVGEIVMDRRDIMNRNLSGRKPMEAGQEVRNFVNTTVGKQNELDNDALNVKCD